MDENGSESGYDDDEVGVSKNNRVIEINDHMKCQETKDTFPITPRFASRKFRWVECILSVTVFVLICLGCSHI